MRKIVVSGTTYLWNYKAVRDNYCRSKLTLISENKDIKFIVQFTTKDTITAGSPLNEGLRVMKEDKPYSINFNQPKYVAEILQYILALDLDLEVKKVYELNGNELLVGMGYLDLEGFLI
ncbi:hypothetical protein [Paenibacillus sp. JJ-223]|uniref:hypothetical protein n=1 Tax=Paenibacillus sp. JJ-223 TaxID=2905647 RepID=UPI001F488825|nr:hypothetical protein [Paenibacillus sp. JJ-223]CAH1225447.1 hypothetical protein PAECIP111890_05803 [Paenibacillus sp. JJ-223]